MPSRSFFLRVLLPLLVGSPLAVCAQTGIGTTSPNAKAALEISATDKGLLIPRLDSAQRTAIAAPPDGLLVFQTNGRTGFWYASGGTWVFIPDKARAGDNLGNHTATQNLNLGVNKLVGNGGTAGLSIASGGNVGIGTPTPAATLEVSGGASTVRLGGLAGPGTRLVTTDASGNLGSQATGNTNGVFWGLSGNAGTAPATNFLGTTDAQDLVFRAANTERLRLTQSGALYQTIANANTFLGLNAGAGINGTAGNNVYVGAGAGQTNVTGADNVAIGLDAGALSTSTSSAMVGTLAGKNSSGVGNTYLGGTSGFAASGNANVGVGYLAGVGMSGSSNVVIGYGVGYSGGTMAGGENVVIGQGSAPTTTGAQNTFLGTIAGLSNGAGSQNTFLGYRTGNDVTTASGNTFVGNFAGRYLSTGADNTLLGNKADVSAGNGTITNATAIGANAHVTQSNSLVLGATGVKVGIGVTAPAKRLHVDANSDFLRLDNLSSVPSATVNNYLVIDASGNVGKTVVENVSGQIIRLGFNGQNYFENNTTPADAEAPLLFDSHSSAILMGLAPNGAENFINTITSSSIATAQVVAAGNGTRARTTDRISLPAGVYRVTVRLVGAYGVSGASGPTRSVFVKCIVNNNEYSLVETLNATADGVTVHNEVSDYLNLSAASTVDFSVRALRNFTTVARLSPGTGNSYRSLLLIERVR